MAIQFIIGAGGTGKTSYMYQEMISRSLETGHEPLIYILPEQSNMAAEQELIMRHERGGSMDISILSFTRLSFMVFDELGTKADDILDDYGKSMLIMKVLKECDGRLAYYKNMYSKPGFVEEMKSILSEFYQYQVDENVLGEVLKHLDENKSLFYKLSDLRLIMKEFNDVIAGKYMVAEQVLSLLKEVAGDSRMLKNASIYFDGFTGFTPVQYSVIEELMRIGCDLFFSLAMDPQVVLNNGYGDRELFSGCKREYIHLCNLAQKNNVKINPHIALETCYRLLKAPELLHLSQNIFRYPVVPFNKEQDNICFLCAENELQEALYVVETIKEYVMDKGYHYRDFAVVSGNVSDMAITWKHCMEQLEIPYFMDYSEPLTHNPIVEVVTQLLNIYMTDFSYESVFAFLKTGFLDIPEENIYEMENYVLKTGIRGYSNWSKSFGRGKKSLFHINETRKIFMDEIEELSRVFQKSKAETKEYVNAIYTFMCNHEIAYRLHEQSLLFEQHNMLREAKAYGQIYEKWISVLDKIVELLGDEEIARDTFSQLLISGISDLNLGVIPPTLDQVVIGDMERTRLHNVKILFVVGVNDGILPNVQKKNNIIKDKERKVLQSLDVTLAPDLVEDVLIQQYYFYMQLSKASEKLYISYRNADLKGARLKPSYYLNRLLSVFPGAEVIDIAREGYVREVRTKGQLVAEFAKQIMEDAMDDSSMYSIMCSRYPEKTQQIIRGYLYDNRTKNLDKSIIRQLYGEHMENSVSKLETYSGCAFQFFLRYGLGIQKRQEYKVESNNIGTILHGVMEGFFLYIKEHKIEIRDLSEDERDRIVESLTNQMAQEENDTIFESSFRKKHQLKVLIRIAKRSVKNLCIHLQQGKMTPSYFEKHFSSKDELQYIQFALEEDMHMELKGIVDRVDIKETENAVYYKVIDYKSGAKDIDYIKLYEGKQLQLTVYMSVMQELLERKYPDKKVIPAGMFYYQMKDSVIHEVDEDKLEEKRLDDSRLTGLVNVDETCRDMLDGKTGRVTPVKYKQDGELSSQNTSLVTLEELENISGFVYEKMKEIGNEIIRGQISINPEKGEISGPCNYCDYKSICRFEPGLGGNHYRILPQIDKNDAKRKIMNYKEEVAANGLDQGSEENN